MLDEIYEMSGVFDILAIGCKSESTKLEIRSFGPPLPETIGLPTGVGLCILVSV